MAISDRHTLYTKDDFTDEEIARDNILAVAVIQKGYKICKRCGRIGAQLHGPCKFYRGRHKVDITW